MCGGGQPLLRRGAALSLVVLGAERWDTRPGDGAEDRDIVFKTHVDSVGGDDEAELVLRRSPVEDAARLPGQGFRPPRPVCLRPASSMRTLHEGG